MTCGAREGEGRRGHRDSRIWGHAEASGDWSGDVSRLLVELIIVSEKLFGPDHIYTYGGVPPAISPARAHPSDLFLQLIWYS